MDQNQQIIIKKSKKGDGGHHGGAWKVAYADFVTAMMALFIVLWILSSSEEVKEQVAAYFQDPLGYTSGGGRSVIEGFGTGMRNPNKKDAQSAQEAREKEKKKLDELGKELQNQLSESKEFKGIIDQISIEIIDEGLRIEIIESGENAFFEIGSAVVKPGLRKLLKIIAGEIAKINNKIAIEGHTDARPFPGSGNGYTNWELSSDRANSTRRVLLESGLNTTQVLEIRGYADNRLRNKENPYDVSNRRISIIVKYTENI